MPIVVFVLAVAVFAQGTSEFMVSGLMAPIAADTGVSLGSAGLLTSLFAAGMVLGAPAMVALAGRLPLKHAAAGFLAAFCLAHVIGAVTTEFAVLLVTRVVAAVANAGFLAVALAALPRLVGPAAVGRATSVVVSGVTVACIAGVPAGTALGQAWGWRSAFWAVAVISAAALVPVWAMIPRAGEQAGAQGHSLLREWAVVVARPVRTAVAAGALVNAATFAGFTYLGTITADAAGDDWVPVVLACFGVGSFLGVTLGGRFSDRHGGRIVTAGTVALVGIWLLAALTARVPAGVVIMAVVSGAVAFGVGSTLIATIVRTAATTAPRIAGALATTTFNIGAVLGPLVAGPVVDGTGRPATALWTAAAFVTVAAAVVVLGYRQVTTSAAPTPVAADRAADPV
ncbi:Cmx/CmrA family chloramphenicol efflux MFS transporter [Nocardia wallacei]|uniref:Cmx/CmrA family chloramphenicol efflux MFS transporter n=1 Tax=Nocardia wallacei TaxID=480035 RepID=UPI0024577C91|nr:Cmx/CmrA family chloramphenicol efflux MFS transporter [Nocardia wallacei]